ncbi:hypothetical protein I6A84_00500 [Frankia sp. CNm7]|uniref:Uncharacterized protein n=1 Tax=Frankia nepalensis TaxID=1836974 RepID=A0A937UMT0_9ACTN|nr:hypothetical protein [Frankia nepalensis]MBL7496634.1 hypothetical protein [Frankia nepalensis]MBL7511892.1 hypothetical protein [Frankia nepalensis]MBL7516643.1 hypothetical protein [Frankia nepalensis]MBL7627373.1 hypothetical protein [Frankia nepalensis]
MTVLLQDCFQVKGREELPFEEALRERPGPGQAGAPGRLVLAAWVPHGAGEGYEFVTLTELADSTELSALYRWHASPDGAAWNATVQGMCYGQLSTLHELRHGTLATVAAQTAAHGGGETRPPLYRLDRLTVSNPADALASVGKQFASGPAAADPPVMTPVACWSPLLSLLDTPQVSVLYRFADDGFRRAVDLDSPVEYWSGELDLEAHATARHTRILRGALGASTSPAS